MPLASLVSAYKMPGYLPLAYGIKEDDNKQDIRIITMKRHQKKPHALSVENSIAHFMIGRPYRSEICRVEV
jgi:hypothetical protein